VWKYDLLPLLEEHYYGRFNREEVHARFGLEPLRAQLAAERTADTSLDTATGSVGEVEAASVVGEVVNEGDAES
jgi:hypothetical protein